MTLFLISSFLLLTISSSSADVDEFTNANNLFTSSVYKQISNKQRGNFLVSPFSAETVLAFAQSGCKDESAQELRNALHLPDSKEKVESAIKSLLQKLKNNNLYSFHVANKMYVKKDFSIKEEFRRAATDVYQADSESIDFTKNVEAAQSVNAWIEKQTNNKITNLISSNDLDEYTRAILINALYFKANWSNPFPLITTGKSKFYKSVSESVEVDTLHHYQEYFDYYECPHLKAEFLELPFQGGEASMVIVLPKEKEGLAALENHLEAVFKPEHKLQRTYINVALPKFRIESNIDFKKVLTQLGVTRIFDDKRADLSGIAGDKGDLIVNKIQQKTFIDVSEGGVEAAAATLVVVAVPTSALLQQPKNFIADHPFIFYIKLRDLIIFAGRVTDPKQ